MGFPLRFLVTFPFTWCYWSDRYLGLRRWPGPRCRPVGSSLTRPCGNGPGRTSAAHPHPAPPPWWRPGLWRGPDAGSEGPLWGWAPPQRKSRSSGSHSRQPVEEKSAGRQGWVTRCLDFYLCRCGSSCDEIFQYQKIMQMSLLQTPDEMIWFVLSLWSDSHGTFSALDW